MAGAGSVQVNVLDFLTGGNVQRSINNDLQMMIRPMLCFASHTILLALIKVPQGNVDCICIYDTSIN